MAIFCICMNIKVFEAKEIKCSKVQMVQDHFMLQRNDRVNVAQDLLLLQGLNKVPVAQDLLLEILFY